MRFFFPFFHPWIRKQFHKKREKSLEKYSRSSPRKNVLVFNVWTKINCYEPSGCGHSCPPSLPPYPVSAVWQSTAQFFFYQNNNKWVVSQFTTSPKRLNVTPGWKRRLISVNWIRWHAGTRCSLIPRPLLSAAECQSENQSFHLQSSEVFSPFSGIFDRKSRGARGEARNRCDQWQEAAGLTWKVAEGKHLAWVWTDGPEPPLVLCHQFLCVCDPTTDRRERLASFRMIFGLWWLSSAAIQLD